LKEIKTGKAARGRALKSLHRCRVSLNQAKKELPNLESSLGTYNRELARAQKMRDHEKKKYHARRQEFQEGIAFLNSFIAYVNQKLLGYKAVGFVEMSEQLLKHSNKLNLVAEAAPVLATLAIEMQSTNEQVKFIPNETLKKKLRDHLSNLLNRIKHDNDLNNKSEKKAAQVFAVYKRRLLRVIATLNKNIARVKAQIVNMQRCIDRERSVAANAKAKILRNGNLLKHAVSMCGSFNREFIDATYNRINEIKTMKTILKIVAKHFKKMPKALVKYLESVKSQWIAYVNSTAFKKFIEYERKMYQQNKRGKLLASLNAAAVKNPIAAAVKGKDGIYN